MIILYGIAEADAKKAAKTMVFHHGFDAKDWRKIYTIIDINKVTEEEGEKLDKEIKQQTYRVMDFLEISKIRVQLGLDIN